ncbi:bifunctional hydroxymethylpyrimidine kinase/phosphomethylpyrimidine kinase [Geobacter sulfurreducens]|uniref:Thiamine biosynthesis bifunctional protein ThiED n=1 Tax=Geobacter sulfurreducens (strain ATCC 51573 / DSM 12127 / PCA) TaxID=243231 RepID=THIED_GEOSL|nr:bifunctional hydroxymethylpyrimidine kinase/phosphomethylpyrimidine kinase [Geobacter sulfurreducens]P61422.1 RecName: Full=Thiamine biosynthesis bifunctional protein ThiED; Includes: RecName: Full=Thiamine-phosphate synthase; Short=TMP-PPase; Short=TP synthase; Short=TPS; AltName: Full=Thiamine-phosphate pyrophosphorylase; Short=TMP pyrophosphorylase; Includes: RecName: Full=Hydroxymethylpyrimidine/phosphomethylpyrimidine kinase; AltName: Full=Hydroxymethylpyrimidine kinase; Short=HMP kinase; 
MASNGHTLRLVINRDKHDSVIRGLYLVTDHDDNLIPRVEAAIDGGARVVQYRNKNQDRESRLALGLELRELCRRRSIPFIVNDDLEMAVSLKADGLHLGQGDGDPREARRVLGPGKIIGVSTHTLSEALEAQAAGVDYIGLGAMFPSRSKEVEHVAGSELLAAIRSSISIPIVAIGGITRDNGASVIDAGADAVAVISAVLSHPDPALAATEIALLFNRRAPFPRGSVLTVAGSDSGGGAGIQADLKTVTLLGSYGSSVLTALTAQNTRGVSGIHGVPPAFVADQLDAVFSDIPVDVVKTGMLFSAETIVAIAAKLTEYRRRMVVVDPVMVAKGGANLIDRGAVSVLKERLFPLAYLVTPNIPEAERLTGANISDEESMREAARRLHRLGARNVLLKGGHLLAGDSVDILFDGAAFHRFVSPRILSKNTHGTGCTFASAIATYLAQGDPLREAIARAKRYITAAIRLAQPLGRGHGPVNHILAAEDVRDR